MQTFSFQCFVFKILNQCFEVCNKHLTNKVCGLKPADSSAWHISSAELSPHKHFQKKKLPEARISWHYEHYLKAQSLSLHFDKRQFIDQVPVSAIQKNRLRSEPLGVHLPASLNHNSLFWCPTRGTEGWDKDRPDQSMLKQTPHKHWFHYFNSSGHNADGFPARAVWSVNCCRHSLLCSITPGGLVWVIRYCVTLAHGTITSLWWHWSASGTVQWGTIQNYTFAPPRAHPEGNAFSTSPFSSQTTIILLDTALYRQREEKASGSDGKVTSTVATSSPATSTVAELENQPDTESLTSYTRRNTGNESELTQ